MEYVRKVKFGLLEIPMMAEVDGEKVAVFVQEWKGQYAICRTEDNIEIELHQAQLHILHPVEPIEPEPVDHSKLGADGIAMIYGIED